MGNSENTFIFVGAFMSIKRKLFATINKYATVIVEI